MKTISELNEEINYLKNTIACLRGENAALKAEPQPSSIKHSSPKCEQCEHFDLSNNEYMADCYSCKRYCSDLFILRESA